LLQVKSVAQRFGEARIAAIWESGVARGLCAVGRGDWGGGGTGSIEWVARDSAQSF